MKGGGSRHINTSQPVRRLGKKIEQVEHCLELLERFNHALINTRNDLVRTGLGGKGANVWVSPVAVPGRCELLIGCKS